MSNYAIFYSNKCKHSQRALELINSNNININKICIDSKNINLPKFLKVVPTIINKENPQPLEGNAVFKWIEQFKNSSNTSVTNTNNQSNNQSNRKPDNDLGGIQPFFSSEMSGYSDNYSYIGNENPMEHSFQFLGNSNINTSNSAQSTQNQHSSDKEKQLNSEYERMMEQRQNDINIPNQIQRQ